MAYRKRRPIKQLRDHFDALCAEDEFSELIFLLRRPRWSGRRLHFPFAFSPKLDQAAILHRIQSGD
jgi:hypothetical protein